MRREGSEVIGDEFASQLVRRRKGITLRAGMILKVAVKWHYLTAFPDIRKLERHLEGCSRGWSASLYPRSTQFQAGTEEPFVRTIATDRQRDQWSS